MRPTTNFALLLLFLGFPSAHALTHDYYPLTLNNEWFYRSVGLPLNDSTIVGSVRVVGDTLLPNGHRYFVLSQADIMGAKYVRSDSASVYYIEPYSGQEQLVFKLSGAVGDTVHITWGPYYVARVSAIDTISIFGESRRMITFQLDGILYGVIRLCDKFGPMTEWRYGDPPPPWPDWGRELVGCTINGISYGKILGVSSSVSVPNSVSLFQNYPNPFNPETSLSYFLPSRQFVTLRISDLTGREVRTLVRRSETQGLRTITWNSRDNNGRQVSSGVYLYELITTNNRLTRRMLLLR
jgi:hypothetical protein